MAMAQHGTCSHQLPLSGLVQARAASSSSYQPRGPGTSLAGPAPMAASSSDQPRGPGTAPATPLGVGEAAEAAAESYVPIELSANVCLDRRRALLDGRDLRGSRDRRDAAWASTTTGTAREDWWDSHHVAWNEAPTDLGGAGRDSVVWRIRSWDRSEWSDSSPSWQGWWSTTASTAPRRGPHQGRVGQEPELRPRRGPLVYDRGR